MTDANNPAQRLAGAFVALLYRDLTPEQFFAAQVANRGSEEGVCASHDHCDANMVMLEAFRLITGEQEAFNLSPDEVELWNAAWNIAKRDHLTDSHTTIETLTAEYAAWCAAQAVDHIDAEELALYDCLNSEQRTWLAWFITRWEIVQRLEDGQ